MIGNITDLYLDGIGQEIIFNYTREVKSFKKSPTKTVHGYYNGNRNLKSVK